MTIQNGYTADANDVLNIFHHNGNVLVGKKGTIYIPVYINNASGDTNIKLAVWGKQVGSSSTTLAHGVGEHSHGGSTSGSDNTSTTGTNIVSYDSVPTNVKIYIDGTDKTTTIGDPNSKGTLVDTNVSLSGTGGSSHYSLLDSVTGLNDKFGSFYSSWTTGSSIVASSYLQFTYNDATTANSNVLSGDDGSGYYYNPQPSKTVTEIKLYAKKNVSGTATYTFNVSSVLGWGCGDNFDTGWLDISSVITWSQGWHYIELEETGDVGGTLIYHIAVNTGG